jgi:hypothetical protein
MAVLLELAHLKLIVYFDELSASELAQVTRIIETTDVRLCSLKELMVMILGHFGFNN